MNKVRRKTIEEIISIMENLKERIDNVSEEEQEAFDNLPEGLQASEKGEKMEENVGILEEASSSLDDIVSNLQELLY